MNTCTATRNVFIVEDSAPVRDRLIELLDGINGVRVVGEATTPQAAITGILLTQPNYVVLDFQLEGGTGLDVLRNIRQRMPGTVFIVLTNHPQAQIRHRCLQAGAAAFFDKSTEFGRVKDIIVGTWSAPLTHNA